VTSPTPKTPRWPRFSLAWLLHKESIDAPIIGPTTTAELDDSIAALDVSLSEEEIDRLEAPHLVRAKGPVVSLHTPTAARMVSPRRRQ